MFRSIALAAVAVLAIPAVAHAQVDAEQGSFSYKGVEYTYTAEKVGDTKIIHGTAYNGKVPFELRVADKTVTGQFNNKPVAFNLKEVQKIEVASR
jgi:hypothetical protein